MHLAAQVAANTARIRNIELAQQAWIASSGTQEPLSPTSARARDNLARLRAERDAARRTETDKILEAQTSHVQHEDEENKKDDEETPTAAPRVQSQVQDKENLAEIERRMKDPTCDEPMLAELCAEKLALQLLMADPMSPTEPSDSQSDTRTESIRESKESSDQD